MKIQCNLNTRRLMLRTLEMDHAAILQPLGIDRVFKFIPEIKTPFDAEAWVKHKSEEPPIAKVAFLKSDDVAIGYFQVQLDLRAGEKSYEFQVGYWLGQAHWGNGYATEALQTILEYVRARFQHFPVRASVHRLNRSSQRVLQKCRFVVEDIQNEGGEMLLYRWERPSLS